MGRLPTRPRPAGTLEWVAAMKGKYDGGAAAVPVKEEAARPAVVESAPPAAAVAKRPLSAEEGEGEGEGEAKPPPPKIPRESSKVVLSELDDGVDGAMEVSGGVDVDAGAQVPVAPKLQLRLGNKP